jgi:uncharacterized protein YbaR (Trm112 family)
MIDAELLAILRCPETYQEIRLADPSLVNEVNGKISAGSLKNRAGRTITEAIDGGLLRADGRILYPIRKNIPLMLAEEGIEIN